MNVSSKKYLIASASIMVFYFLLQMLIIFGAIEPSHKTAMLGLLCLGTFIPTLFIFSKKYHGELNNKKKSFQDKMEAISRSSIIIMLSADGIIKSVNKNFEKILGYKEEEIVGKCMSFLLADNSVFEQYIWKKIKNMSYVDGTFESKTKEEESIWLRSFYSPIIDGERLLDIILIAHDSTSEYMNQLDLINKNKYLEHSAKILRHDMHSGINTYIPRGISSLERRLSPEKIKELKIEMPLRLIKDGLKHTQRVYEGVKAFTNIVKENSVLETEEFCLQEVLEEYFAGTAYSDQVAIGRLPNIKANKALFCTAIDNLVRNGIKYNDSDFKMVAITMFDESHIAVIDNGRGMSSEDFEKLSKPYFRKKNQLESGTGLGLNITVAILKEHGFEISVEKQESGTLIKIKVRS